MGLLATNTQARSEVMKLYCLKFKPKFKTLGELAAAVQGMIAKGIHGSGAFGKNPTPLLIDFAFLRSGAVLVDVDSGTPPPAADGAALLRCTGRGKAIAVRDRNKTCIFAAKVLPNTNDLRIEGYVCTKTGISVFGGSIGQLSEGPIPPLSFDGWSPDDRRLATYFLAIVSGAVKLETLKTPKVTKNRIKIRPTKYTVARHLSSSHDRRGFYRVLTHPKFYKDGIVPTDPAQLRRVPVKPTTVKRELTRRTVRGRF